MRQEKYYVNPENSLKFGGRWGLLIDVKKDSLLSHGLLFDGDTVPYYFSREELMSEKEFDSIGGVSRVV